NEDLSMVPSDDSLSGRRTEPFLQWDGIAVPYRGSLPWFLTVVSSHPFRIVITVRDRFVITIRDQPAASRLSVTPPIIDGGRQYSTTVHIR
ncbi:MAG: hypothetical protein UHI54_06325, partial [Bifidobacterium merycicum]|uniref:hypothetical protein n=1 Tax=Bifidobacterium merycicum TaxID=78345 RepID=UPI002E784A4A